MLYTNNLGFKLLLNYVMEDHYSLTLSNWFWALFLPHLVNGTYSPVILGYALVKQD